MKRLRIPFLRRSPAPMACEQVAELLQLYLDAQLEPGTVDAIAAHLDDCRRCGLEAATYQQIKDALAARRTDMPAESIERLKAFGNALLNT